MTLNVITSNAVNGLLTSQAALRTTSENITNVNTPDYARREVKIGAFSTDGRFSTVRIDEIRRVVDDYLLRETRLATSDAASAERRADIHNKLQILFGSPGDGTSFPERIEQSFTSLSSLTLDVGSAARRIDYIGTLEEVAHNYNGVFNEINVQRASVDRQIEGEVAQVNALIRQLNDLNESLRLEEFNGISDQQDAILGKLSEFLDVRAVRGGDGKIEVRTGDGVMLVGTGYAQLAYAGASPISESTVFPPITVEVFHPQSDVSISQPVNVERNLKSGSIRGLLDLRDKELPELAAQIGRSAALIIDRLNAAHNSNVAFPAPNTLTGENVGLLGADGINFTGQTTLAVTGADGSLVRRIDIDFDAATISIDGGAPAAFSGGTIADLVGDVNGALGAFGTATFTNGVLEIDAANAGEGVAFLDDAANPSSRGGRSFSHFFGLNNIMSAASPSHFDTGLTLGDPHGFTAGQTIDFVFLNDDGQRIARTVTVPAGATMNDLINELNSPASGVGALVTFSLSADGSISTTPQAVYSDFQLLIENDFTTRGGTNISFSQLFGVGPGPQAGQSRNIAVNPNIVSDPTQLALAQLDISGATALGDIVVTQGDNRGALALQQARDEKVAVPATGGMPSMFVSMTTFAERVLGDFAVRAQESEDSSEDSAALQAELRLRRDEIQGVNMDEELANMITYQKSYNAAARILTTATELFDELLRAV